MIYWTEDQVDLVLRCRTMLRRMMLDQRVPLGHHIEMAATALTDVLRMEDSNLAPLNDWPESWYPMESQP